MNFSILSGMTLSDEAKLYIIEPYELEQARKHSYDTLEECCPETRQGSARFLLMHLKPDQETGTHGLPLKGCVIQTPVSPDTSKIPAELFLYNERINAWTETVS